jgi:PAS domain S-box-containing protein
MQISLSEVMQHPFSLEATTPIQDAIDAMNQSQSSYILVMAQQQIVGIFTERDVVKVTATGSAFATALLSDLMTQQVITLNQSKLGDAHAVLHLMQHHHIRHLPIVDDQGQPVGLLTYKDIRSTLKPTDLLKLRQVCEIMTSTVFSAEPLTALIDITRLMADHQISCVVIVEKHIAPEPDLASGSDSPNLRPIGMITERDIVHFQSLKLDFDQVQAQTVMSTPLVTIQPHDSLWLAHQQMQQQMIRRLVVTNDVGNLVGILTQTDLLQILDPIALYNMIETLQQVVDDRTAELEQEVVERQRLIQALAVSEARYRNILNNIPDPVSCFQVDTTITFVNQAYCQYFGKSEQELLGQSFLTLIPEADRATQLQQIAKLSTSKSIAILEHQVIAADGSLHWQQWTNQAICDSSGHITEFQSIGRDITEQKRVETLQQQHLDQLTIWRNRYEAAGQSSGQILYEWNTSTNQITWGANTDLILGYLESEMPGDLKGFLKIIHPEDHPMLLNDVKWCNTSKIAPSIEYRIRCKNGDYRWVEDKGQFFPDDQGNLVCIVGFVSDISATKLIETERQQVEAALRAQEERWQLAIRGNNDGIWDHDLITNQLTLSPRCHEILSYSDHELTDFDQWIGIVHPNDRDLLIKAFQAHINRETQHYTSEYRMRCKDGTYKWLLARGQALWNEQGIPIRAVGSLTDITEAKRDEVIRRQAEAALRESEERFQAFMNHTPVLAWIDNADGQIVYANSAYFRLFQRSPDQVLGKNIFDLHRVKSAQFYQESTHKVLETQQMLEATETVMLPDGTTVDLLAYKFPIASPTGQRLVGGVAFDITERNRIEVERQQAELDLQQAKEAAEAANRAKSEFLSNMSHELRTPLNIILGFTQLLHLDQSLQAEQQEQIDIILQSGDHLLRLINSVLEMSKIDAGRMTLDETNFDLHQLLHSLEDMLLKTAVSKGLQLRFDCDASVPQFVQTDEGKLRQVLINLLSNAIKFTQIGEVRLRVEGQRETNLLYFEIEDTGPGIADSELDNLFEVFVQTEAGRRSQQGTGLGLAISRRFVQLMGGDITVSSRQDEGAIFCFSIRARSVAIQPANFPKTRHAITLAPQQPTYRILVVEDQITNRKLVVRLLTRVGFEVQEAVNGQAAIEQWQSWHPDLILMDMQMPEMNGYEATQLIRSLPNGESAVIIALTASAFEEQRLQMLSAGCNDCIYKPFKVDNLLTTIGKYLDVNYCNTSLPDHPEFNQSTPQSIPQPIITPTSQINLAVMPEFWRVRLYQAATQLNVKECTQLIEQIPPTHSDLLPSLTELVKNLRFDVLIELIEKTQ